MLHPLVSSLFDHQRVAGGLRLSLRLDGGGMMVRELRLPEPSRDWEVLLRPLQTYFDSLELPAPVIGLDLAVVAELAGASELGLFERAVREPSRLADTLARLEALLGPDAVGIPLRADSHRPDAFRLVPFEVGMPLPMVVEPVAGLPPPALPLRRFRPPMVVVVAAESSGHLPRPLALLSGPHRGRISCSRGPFPLSGAWWEPAEAWQRAEWDVATDTGDLLRLAFLPPGGWALEGSYG